MMKKILIPLLAALLLLPATVQGRDTADTPGRHQFIRLMRPIYFIGGIPVDGTAITANTADLKFQLSIDVPLWTDMGGKEGFDLSVGYTQRSVWGIFAPSSPFKDNMYIPGLYLGIPVKDPYGNLWVGIEHRSNGRPYWGARDGGDDDRSRSVNYIFAEYTHSFPFGLSLQGNVRAGFGWYNETFGVDMLTKYLGWCTLTAGYESPGRIVDALVSVSPIFAPFSANVTAEVGVRLGKRHNNPYLFLQYHYGYDEALCDCRYLSGESGPRMAPEGYLRLGILIKSHCPRRLSF